MCKPQRWGRKRHGDVDIRAHGIWLVNVVGNQEPCWQGQSGKAGAMVFGIAQSS